MAEQASSLYKTAVHSDSNPGSADRGKALAFPCYDCKQLDLTAQWKNYKESTAAGRVLFYLNCCHIFALDFII